MQNISTQELIKSIIQRIAVGPDRGRDINHEEAYLATQALLNNELDPVQAAIFLIGLRMKRESMDEYKGIFQALQEPVATVHANLEHIIYLAEPYDGYARHLPMSPFIPAVLAACDFPCVIQGVKSVGPKHGVTAHQVYSEHGIIINSNTLSAQESLENNHCGWAYLDQSMVSPKLYDLQSFRDQIVKRTALTTLERLIRPIDAKRTSLIIGYVHKAYPEIYAAIAKQASFNDTLLIKGIEGGITPALNKPLRSFFATEQHFGEKEIINDLTAQYEFSGVMIDKTSQDSLAKQTLHAGLQALDGNRGNAYDSILLTSKTILKKLSPALEKLSPEIQEKEASKKVAHVLDSGIAKKRFNALRE